MFTTPAPTPVTTPVEVMVAIEELLVVQVPPDGVAVSVIEDPVHTELAPEMAAAAFTVTVWYA